MKENQKKEKKKNYFFSIDLLKDVFGRFLNYSQKRGTKFILFLGVLSLPTLAFFFLLNIYMGVSIKDYTPAFPNDEIGRYHQILTFVHKGFSGGYYTVLEAPSRAKFSHFGVHGPLFIMLYGFLGKIFGWHLYSAPFFNLLFITCSLLLFLSLTNPDNVQMILIGCLFLTFWPLFSYAPTNMQESLHLSIAVVLSGCFYILLYRDQREQSLYVNLLILFFICIVSLIRISWGMLLLPFFIFSLKNKTKIKIMAAALASAALGVVLIYLFRYLCAPYPMHQEAFLMNKAVALETSLGVIMGHAIFNLKALLSPLQTFRPLHLPVIFQTISIIILLIGVTGAVLFRYVTDVIDTKNRASDFKSEMFFHLYNLGSVVLATIFFYYVGNGGSPRVFSSHLMLSTLLLIASRKRFFMALTGLIIISNVMAAPVCLKDFSGKHSIHFKYEKKVEVFKEAVKDILVYETNSNAWCNTLLTNIYPIEYSGLPPGIGTSYFEDPKQLKLPIKSKYIITDELTIEMIDVEVITLKKFRGANIYLNLDADCE